MQKPTPPLSQWIIVSILSMWLILSGLPLSAQADELIISETRNGILETEEATFTFSAQNDEGYVITLTTNDFIPIITVRDAVATTLISSNGAAQPITQMVFIPPQAADYTIILTSTEEEMGGKYRLRIDPIISEAIEIGSSIEAQVNDQQFFTLDLKAGEMVTIQLASADFDPVLRVRDSQGNELAQDDDGGRDLSAYLVFRAPATDTYFLKAAVLDEISGTYVLRVDAVQPHSLTDLTEDGASDSVREGELTNEIAQWEIRLNQGEKLIVEAVSDDFDTYLTLLSPDGFVEFAFDDDSGTGTNSRLIYTVEIPGTFRVQLSGVQGSTASGTYRIEAASGVLPIDARLIGVDMVDAGTVTIGEPITAEVEDSLARYTVEVEAGAIVIFGLNSEDFDAVLVILDKTDAPIAQDDDSGTGSNASLAVSFPQAGTYQILVASFAGAATGTYELAVTQPASP